MICVIYRSPKRDQTFLYVEKKGDFSRIPEALLKTFGEPQYSMMISLSGRKKLANADIVKVKTMLSEQGFYLQVPPPVESLMSKHLAVNK
ncbi:YcgL domain-containing protein [Xenorhabdus bovienii]|uniref:YcgL domain-containing protein n=1 Tax=Xenorhabdus bovienii TaxID=40576 RepID=UPI0023B21E88|nr:YcgL domain-containing protein [Xenorhabdus bovienii]MDE9436072.1 YcgL domain-containing protein [Xenorhabdus bovienii]MDE9464824.1 YcgL domain-containing protein [Xenorhabdus bovienii]MDE9481036.1 YcgL domain-containing protein [Xenorhabdus bovienii]MDE9492550.1 YcgL domain-containing protein [Xenorhabdus bovienii]MDE9497877.1 YcgL domain-containing protein [Xenorhabdus bovienii]